MKRRILVIMVCMLVGLTYVLAEGFGAPDKSYNSKNYDKAIEGYLRIIHDKGTSPEILFNLGNAYYMKNDYGNAMLCYARARKLNPDIDELNNNFDYLQIKVADSNRALQHGTPVSVEPDEKTFFENLNDNISHETPGSVWAAFAAIAFILLLGSVALYFFSGNITARKVGFFSGALFLIFTIAFTIFMFMAAHYYESHDRAVIMAYQCSLHEKPEEASKTISSKLTQGTIVRSVAEEIAPDGNVTWVKVRLNHNYIGWVRSDEIKFI